jgi:hypothetical protein
MQSYKSGAQATRGLKPTLLALVLLFICTNLLRADGGVVQFRKEAGPFLVTLFSRPSPLRTGPADLSVLVESAQTRTPILNATVSLHLRSVSGREADAAATHALATNKLLYAGLPVISEPGTWEVQVTVSHQAAHAVAGGSIQVLPGPPAILHYWPYFAIVPCLIGLFILNQYLKARKPH